MWVFIPKKYSEAHPHLSFWSLLLLTTARSLDSCRLILRLAFHTTATEASIRHALCAVNEFDIFCVPTANQTTSQPASRMICLSNREPDKSAHHTKIIQPLLLLRLWLKICDQTKTAQSDRQLVMKSLWGEEIADIFVFKPAFGVDERRCKV